MPTKTRMLDEGNFVYSPEVAENAAFLEYLDSADHLLADWREAHEASERSPFSSELGQRKAELDRALSGFVDSFGSRCTIKSVKQDPAFLPVSQFFSQYRPLRKPFSILHCSLGMPLHTVHAFCDYSDLASINAALNEDTPFPWRQSGPHDRPCYLFGECIWELKDSEAKQSDEGLVLMFLEMTEQHPQNHGGVGSGYTTSTVIADTDFIPERVRVLVWRRSRGKCGKCGSREGLDFDFIEPVKPGAVAAPEDLQVLCRECMREKSGVI
ncbi:MAG: HNH endonuclease [Planctomycetes bacterium]|nr:HNH endonuclease [Planctomycetota bacterium]